MFFKASLPLSVGFEADELNGLMSTLTMNVSFDRLKKSLSNSIPSISSFLMKMPTPPDLPSFLMLQIDRYQVNFSPNFLKTGYVMIFENVLK